MKNLNLNINFKNLLPKLGQNLGWVFLSVFLILLLFEALEVNTSVQMVLNADREPEMVRSDKGVRINFENYDLVLKRIQGADSFRPSGGVTKDPFLPLPEEGAE